MIKNIGISTRLILTILVGGYFLYCLANNYPNGWHIIDSFDLIIHEAGHTLWAFMGDTMRILAGSVAQVLLPLIFAGYFYTKYEFHSAALLMMWVGYNLINVSIYIGDAVKMELDLLGGEGVIHDWNYLLTEWGMLSQTNSIASLVNGIGYTIVMGSLVVALYYSFTKPWNLP